MNREINIQLNQLSQQQKEDKIKSFLKENKIEVVKKIGEGCFAEVFEAIKIDQNMRVAIKKLKDLKYLKKFQEEKLAMKKIQNLQFAIQLIGELENKELGYYAIIMEFCESDLTQIFEKNKDSCTYEQLLALAYQLLKGLQVFQEKGIIHGDLKPDNILYSQIKNKFLISDLGLSQIMTKPELQQIISKQSQYSNMGNLKYMAPEVAKDQKPFTIKIDVFSVGQILLEFILKKQINLMEHMNLKQKKLLDVFPLLSSHQYNKFVKQLLEKMVCPDQNDRYEAMKLLQILSQFEFDEQSLKSLDFTNKNKIFKLNNQSNFEQNIAMQDQTFKNHISFKQAIELSDIKLKESKKKQKTISITKQNLMDTIDFQSYERANLDFRGESSQKYFLYFYNFNAVKAIQKVQDQKNITDMLLDLKENKLIDREVETIVDSLLKCQYLNSLEIMLDLNYFENVDLKYCLLFLKLSQQNKIKRLKIQQTISFHFYFYHVSIYFSFIINKFQKNKRFDNQLGSIFNYFKSDDMVVIEQCLKSLELLKYF